MLDSSEEEKKKNKAKRDLKLETLRPTPNTVFQH